MTGRIDAFNHQAMSTWWQVRVSGQDATYAAQASQAAFAVTDRTERLMSRFRDDSEISAIASLPPGGRRRLPREVFDCLRISEDLHRITGGAFDVRARAGSGVPPVPDWRLDEGSLEIVIGASPCRLDLGAIAKGFALELMAEELRDWGIDSFLLMSSGSSILAGDPPHGQAGWNVRMGEAMEVLLARGAMGTSGEDMRGNHIVDPATGVASARHRRAWAIAGNAAEADAFSTACMNMDPGGIAACCRERSDIGAVILDRGGAIHRTGRLPPRV
jgi:FAD:protein FMN transferase